MVLQALVSHMHSSRMLQLNTLAMVLLNALPESHGACDPDSPTPKRRKKPAAPTPEALDAAVAALEQSYRIYEKGIDGVDRTMENFEGAA